MNISVILAHPNKGSLNHAIARTAKDRLRKNGNDVILHDRYDEKFDPILPYHEILNDFSLPNEIEIHCNEISSANRIVIVHPNGWGQPPAILKDWVDRVTRPDVVYKFCEGIQGEVDKNRSIQADIDRGGYGWSSPSGGFLDES